MKKTHPGVIRRFIGLLLCAGNNWSSDNGSNSAASLAFFSAFSLAPLLVILLALIGWAMGTEHASAQLAAQLNALFGAETAKTLQHAMESSKFGKGIVSTLVSAATLLLGATTVLAALQQSLDVIWKTDPKLTSGVMGWVKSRFLSLGFILALGFLLLVSLTLTTALSGVRDRLIHGHAGLIVVLAICDFVVSMALTTILFALIFRYMSARRMPWRAVLAGGVLTAILFDAGRWLIGIYLAHTTEPSAFGAASSFVALLLWLYYTAMIFLYGAEFTGCMGSAGQPNTGRAISPNRNPH